ncbi:type III secretion system gatekeeper subunit SctW [Kosakonia cowanii]|uniref:type III secretion system gatekeeper subunit SctW n=1 Tax=Kosakonia cowanii TaxID=208223 RepID=UPI00289C9FC1|nr:type III secretion system gatekeeper subunit SctW [Kosakonia cowanii]
MFKIQHAIPALAHSLKALHKNTPQAAGKTNVPDNVRVRAEALNDAMEEIGAAFSEKMERKQKAQERRNALRNQLRGKHGIGKVAELNELFSLLDGGDEQQALEQMEWLRNALRQNPPPESETLLEKTGGDPARAALLLRMLGNQAHDEGDGELATLAGAQLDKLEQTHGQTIRAGNNTAPAIAGYTSDPQRKQSLRNLYYDGIVHQQSAIMMLDMVLEAIGSRNLIPTLRTLQRALADDMAALAPSISALTLGRIHHGLRDAAGISQTLSDSTTFLQRMRSKLSNVDMNSLTLARRMLQISHNGAYQSDFTGLAQEIVGESKHHEPLFYSSLFPLLRGVPRSLWPDLEKRSNALKLLRGMITNVTKAEQQQQRRNRNAAS